jgi:hypothetical protein
MPRDAARKAIAEDTCEYLSAYSGFPEVDELRGIITAWSEGRLVFRDGIPQIAFEASGDIGQFTGMKYDITKTQTQNDQRL